MTTTQWDSLFKRWRDNHLPHAVLLSGITEIDKKNFALRFAKLILCQQNTNREQACDHCHACQLFTAETHPDLQVIQPAEEGKIIKVDQIRDLIAKLTQTAQQGGYKVAIITPAELLPVAAANALLKTLEEPAARTLFMLISDSPGLLPATIRSRCQNVIFSTSAEQKQTENYEKLFNNLKDLAQRKMDPIQLASQLTKESLEEIVNNLTLIVMRVIKSQTTTFNQKLFLYLDQLYQLRKLPQINLNQQLLLENLFCTWSECYAS